MNTPYVFALHGGAGTIAAGRPDAETPYRTGLRLAAEAGEAVLARGGSALEAVVAAVVELENCPLFNAGLGAAFNAEGQHELDAGVMDGHTLAAGAVAGVRCVRNPVLAAREVLLRGQSVLLGADGAERLARDAGLAMVDMNYFSTDARRTQLHEVRHRLGNTAVLDHDGSALEGSHRFGTVGAVARDRRGHLAAATSTGGMTNKPPGRIGDTPLMGSGVYANDASCAVSCTGTGEHFMRACLAHDIHARMRYLGHDAADAAQGAFAESLTPLGGRGGAVVIGRDGTLAMPFNSAGMYRAWVREGEPIATAIFA